MHHINSKFLCFLSIICNILFLESKYFFYHFSPTTRCSPNKQILKTFHFSMRRVPVEHINSCFPFSRTMLVINPYSKKSTILDFFVNIIQKWMNIFEFIISVFGLYISFYGNSLSFRPNQIPAFLPHTLSNPS